MNAERTPDTLAQFTKVFTYRPKAIIPYALGLVVAVMTMGFFLWVAVLFEAFSLPLLILLSVPIALASAYTLYLWFVIKTALLVVTEHGLVYSDRWVRRALLWSEVGKVTRFSIHSKKGKGIALRLGIKALENCQELLNIVRELSDAQIMV